MWTIKQLTAVDSKGNTITVEDKKITIAANLNSGIHVKKKFPRSHAPPVIEVAIQDLIRQLCVDASNIN